MSTNATYVRWRKGESRRLTVFPALEPDDPSYGALCLLCGNELGLDLGDMGVQLIALHPDDGEAREKFEQGRWTTCHGLIVHGYCAGRCSDAELDDLAGSVQFESPPPEQDATIEGW